MPGAQCTRSLACESSVQNAHEYSQRSHRKSPGIPARNGLRLIPRSPRRSGFLASVACGVFSANLTPASRRQDHTSSPSASAPFVIGTASVHRMPPRVRDDREQRLMWDRTAIIFEVIWVGGEQKYFCEEGWTEPKSANGRDE